MSKSPKVGPVIPLPDGWNILPDVKIDGGGDVHETFRIDQDGNVDGHSTIQVPGLPNTNVPWPKPGGNSGSGI